MSKFSGFFLPRSNHSTLVPEIQRMFRMVDNFIISTDFRVIFDLRDSHNGFFGEDRSYGL